MIDLKHHIASQIKLHLYFDGYWILISEVTFDSFIVPINLNIKSSQSIQLNYYSTYIIICILTIIIVLLFIVIIHLIKNIFIKNVKHYATSTHNHTDSTVSTTSTVVMNRPSVKSSRIEELSLSCATSPATIVGATTE